MTSERPITLRRLGRATAVALCGLATCAALAAAPAHAASTTLDRVSLDAYQATNKPETRPVSSKIKLRNGGLYVASVQGTIGYYAAINFVAVQAPWKTVCGKTKPAPMFASAGGGGQVSNDAEFIFAQPVKATTCADVKLPARWNNFQANPGAGGWQHPELLAAGAPTAPNNAHRYQYAFVGKGKRVSFKLVDPDTRDNYGSLLISLRAARAADCAGRRYAAFGFKAEAPCVAAAGLSGKAAVPRYPVLARVDQGPIARVLRIADAPGAYNYERPSGALALDQFVRVRNRTASQVRDETTLLKANGFRAASITDLYGPGRPQLTSTAIKLASAAKAQAVFNGEAQLAAKSRVPPATTVQSAPSAGVPRAVVVTYAPTAPGGLGGFEIIARADDYVYSLRALQVPATAVTAPATEQLLRTIIARR